MTNRASILIISHGLGGGVDRHVTDVQSLLGCQFDVELLRPAGPNTVSLTTFTGAIHYWVYDSWDAIVDRLSAHFYSRVWVHHIAGFPPEILALPNALQVPYDFTAHDFAMYCPQYSLNTPDGTYCGEPDAAGCGDCVRQRPNEWGWDVQQWREQMARFIGGASRVFAPTRYVKERLSRHFQSCTIELLPHPPRSEWSDSQFPAFKVMLIGGINRSKGLNVLINVARWAHETSTPLFFTVLGYIEAPVPEELRYRIDVVGEYSDADLPSLAARQRADVIWFPNQIPESYSYTLSISKELGLPIVASDLGALRERLANRNDTRMLSFDASAREWGNALMGCVGVLPAAGKASNLAAADQQRREFIHRIALPVVIKPRPTIAQNTPAGLREITAPPSCRPTPSLNALFDQAVYCGHAESRTALRNRLIEVERDYHVLETYEHETGRRWYSLIDDVNHLRGDFADARRQHDQQAKEVQRLNELHERNVLAIQARDAVINGWARRVEEMIKAEKSLSEQLDHYRELMGRLETQSMDMRGQRDIAVNQIRLMESSTSWRITAPIRRIGAVSKPMRYSFRRRASVLPYVLHRLPRAWYLLRTEGANAVFARLRQKLGGNQFSPVQSPPARLASIKALYLATASEGSIPRVSIIVPAYEHHEHTFHCLESLGRHTTLDDVEIIVMDDASPTPVRDALGRVTGVTFLRAAKNGGFIASCNYAAAQARGEFLVFLNNDTEVTEGWLEALIGIFRYRPDAGLVGARLVYPDGRLQEAGGIVWQDGSAWNWGRLQNPDAPPYNYVREVDYCSGACIAIRNTDWRSLGGFDETFCPAYYEDTDLAFRIRAVMGKKVYYQPLARVIHFEGVSSGTDLGAGTKQYQTRNHTKFFEKWEPALRHHRSNGLQADREADRNACRHVLIVEACMITPDHDSGSVRMLALIELLIELGCKVSFVADNLEFRQPYVSQLQTIGVELWHYPFISCVDELLEKRGSHFDAVILCRHYIAARLVPLVRRFAPHATLIFDTVDLHYLRELRHADLEKSSALYDAAWRTRTQELSVVSNADLTWVVSPVEVAELAKDCPMANVQIISNIHSIREAANDFAQRSGLIFVGGFRHPPNVDAVLWFVSEVWPLISTGDPELTLSIVGSNMPESISSLQFPGVNVLGYVEDIEPLLDAARISIAPLRYGAGVKGKINQAMACGLPVIATSVAAEGMGIEGGRELLVADTPEAFSDAVLRLYRDPMLWERLVSAGKENINQHFSRSVARRGLAAALALPVPIDRPNCVDVIVPVFGQIELVRKCLISIFSTTQRTPFEIVVIDDASEEPELVELLDDLASSGQITLIRNESNIGFVGSVNRGLDVHRDRNVVLLNSDTEVCGRWLDKLVDASRSQSNVCSVTPWSNNATICSYPNWPEGGGLADPEKLSALDQICCALFDRVTVQIPTAVGFCMFILRESINVVGRFDEEAFGRGYGEENDFCMKASRAGFVHLLAADTYVYHAGGASFGLDSEAQKVSASAVLSSRWPEYDGLVREFIARAPLEPLLLRLDRAWAA